jgi:hypothetical protein
LVFFIAMIIKRGPFPIPYQNTLQSVYFPAPDSGWPIGITGWVLAWKGEQWTRSGKLPMKDLKIWIMCQWQLVGGAMICYVIDTAAPLTLVLAETTGTETIYYLHGLDLVAQNDGAATEYFAYDGLGSVRQMLDGSNGWWIKNRNW